MPRTGDRELYFDVLRALTEEKLTEGKSLRTFPRQMYYPTTGAEIWLLQTPAAERAPPGIQHWETQFERFRATEKKQTQRLGGRQSKHQNSWRWTNMYLGGGIINGSVVSQVWNIQGQTWLRKHEGPARFQHDDELITSTWAC